MHHPTAKLWFRDRFHPKSFLQLPDLRLKYPEALHVGGTKGRTSSIAVSEVRQQGLELEPQRLRASHCTQVARSPLTASPGTQWTSPRPQPSVGQNKGLGLGISLFGAIQTAKSSELHHRQGVPVSWCDTGLACQLDFIPWCFRHKLGALSMRLEPLSSLRQPTWNNNTNRAEAP